MGRWSVVMTAEQFKAEKDYRTAMGIANSMLKQGILTKAEYGKFNTIMLKKFSPILGSL